MRSGKVGSWGGSWKDGRVEEIEIFRISKNSTLLRPEIQEDLKILPFRRQGIEIVCDKRLWEVYNFHNETAGRGDTSDTTHTDGSAKEWCEAYSASAA